MEPPAVDKPTGLRAASSGENVVGSGGSASLRMRDDTFFESPPLDRFLMQIWDLRNLQTKVHLGEV